MLLYQGCKRGLSWPWLIFCPWKVLHTDLANLPSALGAHGSLLCETFQYGGTCSFPNNALLVSLTCTRKGNFSLEIPSSGLFLR